jgi:hypothetical protein
MTAVDGPISVKPWAWVCFPHFASNLPTNSFWIGNLLLKRLLLAIPKAQQSRRDFVNFDESLRAEIPDEVAEMEQNLAAWELNRDRCDPDKTFHDPYQIPKSSE